MDRRYKAYQRLVKTETVDGQQGLSAQRDAQATAEILTLGKETEFWRLVTAEIASQIRATELLFLDRMARSYEEYLIAWSRRQALIAALAIPETATRPPHATA